MTSRSVSLSAMLGDRTKRDRAKAGRTADLVACAAAGKAPLKRCVFRVAEPAVAPPTLPEGIEVPSLIRSQRSHETVLLRRGIRVARLHEPHGAVSRPTAPTAGAPPGSVTESA